MAGGKGGSTSTSVEIPEYIEEAARRNLAKAEGISQIGYVPYFGPDVAAFTPFQQAGFQQTADTASAFGLGPQTPMSQQDIMGGMPAPTEYAGGVMGYSAQPLYQQAVDQLAAERPAQAQYIESFFIDPVTGQVGTNVPTALDYSTLGTIGDQIAAQQANELAIAQAQAGAGPSSVFNITPTTTIEGATNQYDFTPSTEVIVGDTNVGGTTVGGTVVGGQEVQYYNPDINYEGAYTAESGQQVGVLDPNEEALAAMQTEAGVDPSFYTSGGGIASASDFPLGSSLSGTDYTGYSGYGIGEGSTQSGTPVENNVATNAFGSTMIIGGEFGPTAAEAEAAGFYLTGAAPQDVSAATSAAISEAAASVGGSPENAFVGFADFLGNMITDVTGFIQSGGVIGAVVDALGNLIPVGGNAGATAGGSTVGSESSVNEVMENIVGSASGYDDPFFAGGAATWTDPDAGSGGGGGGGGGGSNIIGTTSSGSNIYSGTAVGVDPVTGLTQYSFG